MSTENCTVPVHTEIISNGSHMAGSGPSSIDDLKTALKEYALDRRFEMCGNFHQDEGFGVTRFFGNFFNLSHVFQIRTNDAELIASLVALIAANKQRPDYTSQPDPAKESKERLSRVLNQVRQSRGVRS